MRVRVLGLACAGGRAEASVEAGAGGGASAGSGPGGYTGTGTVGLRGVQGPASKGTDLGSAARVVKLGGWLCKGEDGRGGAGGGQLQ